jgi:hypothetical protein
MRYDIHTVSKIITEDPNLINQEALNEATIGQNLALGAGLLGGMMGIGGQTANAQTPPTPGYQANQIAKANQAKHKVNIDISWVKPQHIQRLTSEGSLRQSVGDDLEAILSMYNAYKGDEKQQTKISEKFGSTFGAEFQRYQSMLEGEMKGRGYDRVEGTKPQIARNKALIEYDKGAQLTDFAVSTGVIQSKVLGERQKEWFKKILGLN